MSKSLYSNMFRFMSSLKKFYPVFTFIVLMSLISSGLVILYPLIFRKLVVTFQQKALRSLILLLAAYALIQIIQGSLQSAIAFIRRKYAINANKRVISHFYNVVQSLPLKVFRKFQSSGEIYQRVVDSMELNNVVVDVATGLVILILNLMVYLGIIFYLNWMVGLAILAIIPVYYVLNRIFSPKVREYQELSLLNNSPLTNHLFDCLNRITPIKALGAKEQVMTEVNRLVEVNSFHQLNLVRFNSLVSWINGSVTRILTLVVISFVVLLLLLNRMDVAGGLVILALLQQVFDPLQRAIEHFVDINRAFVILNRYYDVIEKKQEQEEQNSHNKVELNKATSIEFKNVVFSYNGTPVINDLNLDIPAGKRVAFVGRTGVGKSTMMSLVLGLYKAQSGQILIDGHNISDIDLEYYRKQLGVVLQNEYIFNSTLLDNVTFGLTKKVTEDEVIQALKNAELWDTVDKMPQKLHTQIKDETLSGGEKQRLTIARAFLRNPYLILFDEPTSSLDMETEAKIQEAIDKLMVGRTSITIAHRLSTIRKSDIIFVVRDGVVAERGNHDQLVALGGYYARLYEQSIVA